MADHRIGGVGGLVGDAAGKSEGAEPERRGDDAVREILGEAFDGGPAHPGGIEGFGIAADD